VANRVISLRLTRSARRDNNTGQLGYTTSATCGSDPCSQVPQTLASPTGMASLGAGGLHSLAAASSATRLASTTYAYDELYRLTGAAGSSSTTSYNYDPVGNRLSKVLNGTSTGYSYDKADRILTAGSTTYSVNNAGNLVTRGTDGFGYDQANRLTSASVGAATGTYVYDGDGKRVSKTVGSTTTNYLYDIVGGLPLLLDDGARKYVYGLGLVYSVDKSTAAAQVYHTDGLRSMRGITDSTGNVVQTYQTDEFGVPMTNQGSSAQPFGYAGEQRDPEDGLVYLRARMYDPTTGRFVQQDVMRGTAERPCTLNRGTYAEGNPVGELDPSGLFTCSVSLGASASLPASGGLSLGIGFDDKGSVGVFYAPQYGGSTNIGASGSVSVALLNEPDIFRLSGPFVYGGGSVSISGIPLLGAAGEAVFDPSMAGSGFVGVQAELQIGKAVKDLSTLFGYRSVTSAVYKLNDVGNFLLKSTVGGSPLGQLLDACQQAALTGGQIKSMILRN
jgi:RHS repeat-associated protein